MKMWMTFLYPLLGLIVGILLLEELHVSPILSLSLVGLSLLAWVVIHKLSQDPYKSMFLNSFHYLWIIPLFIGIGILDAKVNISSFQLQENEEGKQLTIIGTIYDSQSRTTGDKIFLKIDSISYNNSFFVVNNAKIVVLTDGFTGTNGDIVKFKSKIFSFKNSNDWSNEYAFRMQHSGIDFYARVRGNNINVIGQSGAFSYKISNLRDKFIILLDKSSLSKNSGNFLISILLGNKSILHPEIRETITHAGMAHILALSGMHVAIIFSIVLMLLFPFASVVPSPIRKVVAIMIIWMYVLLTGSNLSTLRAALMITFVVWAFLLERKHSPLNSLFAAAFFIIFFDPLSLWDIGFQLSFLCVASIILFVEKFNPIERHQHPKTYNIINICLISLVVTMVTSTLTLYYFGKLPVFFLPSNLILVPLLPLFVGAGILYLVLLLVGIDFTFLAKFIDGFYGIFIDSAFLLSGQGGGQLSLKINECSVFLWILAVLFLAFGIHTIKRKNFYKTVSATLFGLSIISIVFYQEQDNRSITFKHSFTAINVTLKSRHEHKNLTFPRQSISTNEDEEYVITAVDCPLKEEVLYDISKKNDNRKKFLIIGPNALENQMAYLIGNGNYHKIILHANIGSRQKEILLDLINESIHSKIHSLRDDGSIEFYL